MGLTTFNGKCQVTNHQPGASSACLIQQSPVLPEYRHQPMMSNRESDNPIPSVDSSQMVEVDRLMIEQYGILLIQMMENAGRNLAALARSRFLDGDPRGRSVVVLAGSGGNGGGALVCARRLHNWGASVRVITSKPAADFTGVPAHQLAILNQIGIPITTSADVPATDLIVDGLIGYSLQGAPRGAPAALIRWANAQGAPVLALDTPSGIDTATGTVHSPAIRAAATLTLALPKTGLLQEEAADYAGEIYLGDISVPPELYGHPGLDLPQIALFAEAEILRIR